MNIDQRERRRLRGGDGAFAAFIRPDAPIVVGRIVDVSPGGLGVHYIAPSELGEGPARVGIFSANSTEIDRLKSTVVYDVELPGESLSSLRVRRCGIRFDQPPDQEKLRGFAVGETWD